MNGRTQRIQLAHRAVAEEFLAEFHRREQQRDGGARHQMIERQLGSPSQTLHPCPLRNRFDTVIERNRLARSVARRAQRERIQMAAGDAPADSGAIDMNSQQLPQRTVVEKRFRRRQHETAGHQGEHPMEPGAQHVHGVDVEHLVGTEIGPHAFESEDCAPPVMRLGSEHARGNSSCGSAHDHLERVAGARHQLGECQQHSDLVRRTRTTARQDQPYRGPAGGAVLGLE